MSASDDTARNVEAWTSANVAYTDASALEAWSQAEITWGVFGVPEAEVRALGDVAGKDVCELGCGTAYFSAWLARRGARPVGVDPTPAQLETARRCQAELGVEFPLIEAGGEAVPVPEESFDLVVSEHGAATWANPERWLPEAARLLRPGGRLVFCHTSPLATVCLPDEGSITTELQRPYFGLRRLEWPGEVAVAFQLTHGGWIDVLRRSGFEIERLAELRAPEGAERHRYYTAFDPEWGRRWPAEEIWAAHKA
jgi:SAM-dependent methyltransferase